MLVVASPPADGDLHWWQIATGIIGVPAAIIGIWLTWNLARKARLESIRTDLEIREKKLALHPVQGPVDASGGLSGTATQLMAEPILQGQRVQSLVLRLIVVLMVSNVWSLVGSVFSAVYGTTLLGISSLGDQGSGPVVDPFHVAIAVVQALPQVGYLLIVVGIGFPLLLDALEMLDVAVPEVFRSSGVQLLLMVVAVAVPIFQQITALIVSSGILRL